MLFRGFTLSEDFALISQPKLRQSGPSAASRTICKPLCPERKLKRKELVTNSDWQVSGRTTDRPGLSILYGIGSGKGTNRTGRLDGFLFDDRQTRAIYPVRDGIEQGFKLSRADWAGAPL